MKPREKRVETRVVHEYCETEGCGAEMVSVSGQKDENGKYKHECPMCKSVLNLDQVHPYEKIVEIDI